MYIYYVLINDNYKSTEELFFIFVEPKEETNFRS